MIIEEFGGKASKDQILEEMKRRGNSFKSPASLSSILSRIYAVEKGGSPLGSDWSEIKSNRETARLRLTKR
jgi:hypothetical protein